MARGQRNSVLALLILVFIVIVGAAFLQDKNKLKEVQAKKYASGLITENKEVFDRLAKM